MSQPEEEEEEEKAHKGRKDSSEEMRSARGRSQAERLYNWKRADDIQEGHGAQKMNQEIERFWWKC